MTADARIQDHETHWSSAGPGRQGRATAPASPSGGCLSRKTGLAIASRLVMSPQATWRNVDCANRLPGIIQGIEFEDGTKRLQHAA